jgi:multiple sugar transport system ATP-binding protein
MTVRQNLGYALRVRKLPKAEIKRRVEDAAKLLGLDGLLDRRPGALSGGQMQRVAMGRAIVREPKAFLMDEPLSNLDAKLRVGMRTSLQQLHRRIGTTTVYVTHDQVEAMTLGKRVAVMRDGRVQQVDEPSRLYDEPANLFVAAFIGSPAMNLLNATIAEDEIQAGSLRIPLDRERRPSAQPGGRVVVGIRPEAFEDIAFAAPGLPRVDVDVEVLEAIGSDAYVFFRHDADAVVIEDARSDDKEDDGTLLTEDSSATLLTARVDARTRAEVGGKLTLALDPSRLYFFSPETGESLLGHRLAGATAS